jgi:hypothetical protein
LRVAFDSREKHRGKWASADLRRKCDAIDFSAEIAGKKKKKKRKKREEKFKEELQKKKFKGGRNTRARVLFPKRLTLDRDRCELNSRFDNSNEIGVAHYNDNASYECPGKVQEKPPLPSGQKTVCATRYSIVLR